MKHTLRITLLLVCLFLIAHFLGLIILNNYSAEELPLGLEPPEVEENTSFIPVFIGILLATVFMLFIARFRGMMFWKVWFFITITLTLTIAFGAFLTQFIAILLAIAFALLRLFKNNVYIHNFSEMFIYGGLASIFVPVFNLFSISILLILISVYDYISVFKTKHMIKLAKMQTKSKIFTGLFIPYNGKTAILGGGDIGFTLLFSGVILKESGIVAAVIVSSIVALSLFGLLVYSKKNKFYPAMPPLTIGCFIGLLIVKLLF
ncbi:MAG TPA: presenilin family intramembrane aspartyl protease [Candidatus Nanoarchaeia archaeon]|nr:presenilin family intramembrane aspartyl protease [Candidatus Nanoarchaeia archaeon]